MDGANDLSLVEIFYLPGGYPMVGGKKKSVKFEIIRGSPPGKAKGGSWGKPYEIFIFDPIRPCFPLRIICSVRPF